MRSELFSIFRNPEAAMETQLASMLRTPGFHRLLHTYRLTCQSEVLGILYDIWAMSKEYPDADILDTYINRWNIDVGLDSNRHDQNATLHGIELFAHDLEELCVAVNTLMQTNELSAYQVETCTKAEDYFRELGGVNPGAISIARGWHELMLVIRGTKVLARCVVPECGRLLVYDNQGMLLSGTEGGYHSEKCLVVHTGGTAVAPANLPGMQEAADAVGQVIQNEAETVAEVSEQQPEGPGGQADLSPGSPAE